MAKIIANNFFWLYCDKDIKMPKVINPVPRFNYHNKKEASSTIVVKFSYSFHGKNKRLVYSPGIKIEKKFWNFESQYPKTHPSTNQVRSDLNKLATIILEVHQETQGSLSIQELRKELDHRFKGMPRPEEATRIIDFLQFFKFFISQKAEKLKTGEIKESTMIGLNSIYSKLEKYCQETGQELTLEAINSDFRQSLIEWCFEVEGNSIATVNKYLKKIKEAIKEARERSLTNNTYPEISGWFMKDIPKENIALSESELEAIFKLDLKAHPEGYQKARQLFLIGAYTGLRVSDYTRIEPSHINTEQGEQIIRITAQKTGKPVSIPLHPNLKAILEECNYKAPKLSEQKLNDYIKEVAMLAGITEERIVINTKGGKRTEGKKPKYQLIKSHSARRTFATISYAKGLPIVLIMAITGHTREEQFNKYIDKTTLLAMQAYSDLNKNRQT
jgi:integrase